MILAFAVTYFEKPIMKLDFSKTYWKWIIPLLCVLYCLIEVDGTGDFYIFLSAASDLDKHLDIFSKGYFDSYHYYYSVLFALILKPFVSLPFLTVKFFWILLNSFLFFNLFQMLYKNAFVNKLGDNKNVFVFLVFIVALRFFRDNIHTSQITILILWCCIKGLALIISNKPLSGALILAIGINIKMLPIVFLPYLIYRGYFKAVFLIIFFYTAFMFFPSLIIGHQYNMALLSTWSNLINPTNQNHVLDVNERSFHSLTTLLTTLFIENAPDFYALKIPRNITNVSVETLSKIILFMRLIVIGLTLFFLEARSFVKSKIDFNQYIEISYLLLLIPLIFPHQQHYAFLFAVPAYSVILYYVFFNANWFNSKKVILVLLTLIYLIFNLTLLLGQFNQYYDHFKIITYGALLLIPLLVIVSRKELSQKIFNSPD